MLVLNVLAFILVGFQLKGILGRTDERTVVEYAVIGAAVCGTAIVARIVWLSLAPAVGRWRCRSVSTEAGTQDPVALDGTEFPFRDLVLFVAFCVTLGTLVLQGMTLRPLMSLLRLEDDGSVDREVTLGCVEISRAALVATADRHGEDLAGILHRRYEVMLRRAEADAADGHTPRPELASDGAARSVGAAAVRTALSAERQRLVALRASGMIGDPVFQQLEQGLDLEELHLQQLVAAAGARGEG